MTLDDDETAFLYSQPHLLPFRFAGRLSDDSREILGEWAAEGAYDLLASVLAGDISRERVPMTPEERDIVVAGMCWNDMFEEDEDERAGYTWLERHPIVTPEEVEALVARWRFEPAGPAATPWRRRPCPCCPSSMRSGAAHGVAAQPRGRAGPGLLRRAQARRGAR